MMRLPRVSGRECVRALEQGGFIVIRQRSSHIILRRDNPYSRVTAPDHRELDSGTLRAIIRQAGLTVQEFNSLL